MTETLQWEVAIDSDGDGYFNGPNTISGTTYTYCAEGGLGDLLRSLIIQRGATSAHEIVARSNTAQLTFDGSDYLQFLATASQALPPPQPVVDRGMAIRVRSQSPTTAALAATNANLGFAAVGIGDGTHARVWDGTATDYLDMYYDGLEARISSSTGTIIAWVYCDAAAFSDADNHHIIELYFSTVGQRIRIYLAASTQTIRGQYRDGVTIDTIDIGNISAATWYMVTLTWDKSGDAIGGYLNTTACSGASGLATISGALNHVALGARWVSGTTTYADAWEGRLAHIAVFDTVLSSTQVSELYADWQAAKPMERRIKALKPKGYWLCYAESNAASTSNYSHDMARWQTHFTGWVQSVQIDPDHNNTRNAVLDCVGYFDRLMAVEAALPVQEGKRSDEVISALITSAAEYPPVFAGWVLGHPRLSRLGRTTRLLTGASDYSDLDVGQTVFHYAGDNWERGTSVRSAIQQIADAERAFLIYENRYGEFVFRNRHYPWLNLLDSAAGALTASVTLRGRTQHARGARLLNDCTVSYNPRYVQAGQTLHTIQEAVLFGAGETRSMSLRYEGGAGEQVGGRDVSFTFAANAAADGSGEDLTGNITTIETEYGNRLDVEVTNNAAVDAYIQAGSYVAGTKITDYGRQSYRKQDDDSIFQYGRAAGEIPLTMLDDAAFAAQVANFEVLVRRASLDALERTAVHGQESAANMILARSLDIGDRVTHSGYRVYNVASHIVGITERWDLAGGYISEFILRPAPTTDTPVWVLGNADYGDIGETTYLAL